MRPEADRSGYCRATEHVEIESLRKVSRETVKSKAVIAPRG